ncbi:hypothetical protein WICMUC_005557 [Wickerhamomyces mucosus]|uniref:F-actin-capping protein subunit alpha n=1 Tax=Wickerhamomyces mucosus TaxID=1378264 RepID=A0A9P8P6E0_9ASCO|nr:hypothetical protein WICMUC_005557 [Wickerhamomyces mucosus]
MATLNSVLKDLINSAPSEELSQVIKSINTLKSTSSHINNIDDELETTLKLYDLQNIKSVIVNDESTLLSLDNLQNGWFIDELRGFKFQYDHLNRTVTDIETIPQNDKLIQLNNKLGDYFANFENYSYVLINDDDGDDDDQSIKLVIKSSKSNASNFYSGSWISKHTITDSSIISEIQLHVHYYEEGNVHLTKPYTTSTSLSDSNLSTTLKQIETEFQTQLLNDFEKINEKKFKGLRRLLPITRAKVNWVRAVGRDIVN